MITIITHDGTWHTDDAMACAIIQLSYPLSTIRRTRNPADFPKAAFVVDVGGKYDPDAGLFDHHQIDSRQYEDGQPYAAAGLVWDHFARKLADDSNPEQQTFIKAYVSNKLIKGIDDLDNRYSSVPQHIPDIGNTLRWLAGSSFQQAVEFCKQILGECLKEAAIAYEESILIKEAINESVEMNHPEYVILPRFIHDWQRLVSESDALVCVFPDISGTWRVQAVLEKIGSWKTKIQFPKSWAIDPRNAEIEGLTFCHKAGYLCATTTKEAAVEVAKVITE